MDALHSKYPNPPDLVVDIAKIEAGKLELEQTDFELGTVLDHLKSLVVEVDAGDSPCWLRGDSNRLLQALLNCAGDAIKFTAHGTIAVRARIVEDQGAHVLLRFEVRDAGVGIAPAQIAQPFDAFEQADAPAETHEGGAGPGLAITRSLARLMGGDAGAVSEPGRGSTFWFTARLQRGERAVPAVGRPAQSPDFQAELRERHRGARILLAEDNEVNQEVAQELLRAAGCAVDTAGNGCDAVEMAGRGRYDLVLMDVHMPLMDGLTATRAIRALPGWERTPILTMTADFFDESRQDCRAAGMDDFVMKPFRPDDLYAALLKWLPTGAGATPPA